MSVRPFPFATAAMFPAIAAIVILVGSPIPAFSKGFCPPGEFTISAPGAAIDGKTLVLGEGRAEVAGMCTPVRSGRYRSARGRGGWLVVRARWRQCEERRLALLARWNGSNRYCTQLVGKLRVGAQQRIPFVAHRVPVCGNGIREAGEQCDGPDGTYFDASCCTTDCRVPTRCRVMCDDEFRCAGDELCVGVCGDYGSEMFSFCAPRGEISCDDGPVCACDFRTTFSSACDAYAAGTGVRAHGICSAP